MRTLRSLFLALGIPAAGLLAASPLQAFQQEGPRRAALTFFGYLFQPKFIVMLVIGLTALIFLLSRRMSDRVKVPLLLLSTFLFGVAGNLPVRFFSSFSMHPSPICAATKSILYGFRIPMIVTFAVILFLTLIGPKLFCGWVCPVGALQELIAMASDRLKIKRIRWNFTFSNAVRIGIFLLFAFLSGTAVIHTMTPNGKVALSFYDYINAFHGFEFGLLPSVLGTILHYLPLALTIILAFKLYRPFCYLVCPIGLFSHWVEQFSLFRVTLKRPPCDDCGACERKAPCPTVPDILGGATLRPDCFSCDVCVRSCPKKALEFGVRRTRPSD